MTESNILSPIYKQHFRIFEFLYTFLLKLQDSLDKETSGFLNMYRLFDKPGFYL